MRKKYCLLGLTFFLAAVLSSCATSTTVQTEKKSDSEIAQLYVELGTAALLRGDYSQTISDLKRALTHDSKNPVGHNHLGLAYYGLNKKDLAKAEFEAAIEIQPDYSDAHVNLGVLASESRNYKLARDHYKKALTILEYKFRHRALTNLAEVALSENKLDEARELLYQSIQANPDYCLSHFLLGSIYLRENNASKAVPSLKKSVTKTCVNNPEGHFQLGLAYVKAKEYERARQEFLLIVQEFPQTVQANRAGEQLRALP